jgi:Transcription initiation factor IID, 18kD subunit
MSVCRKDAGLPRASQPKKAKAGTKKAQQKTPQKPRKAEPELTPEQEEQLAKSWKNAFKKDLPDLMLACGDCGDPGPNQETVEALEAVCVEFVRDVVGQALAVSTPASISSHEVTCTDSHSSACCCYQL